MGIGAYRHLVTLEDPRHPLPIAPVRARRPSVAVTSAFPTTGLVSYWKLDEASGTRVDSVGTNHLTPTNAPVGAPGKIGNACDFEADSLQYVSHADPTPLGDEDFTYTIWFKREALLRQVVLIGKDVAATRAYWLEISAGGTCTFYFGAAAVSLFFAFDGNNTNWNFLVIWHNATANTLNGQINNGAVNSVGTGGVFPTPTVSAVRIGAREYPGFEDYFDGLIDEVGLWRRVLPAQERTDLWNGGAGGTLGTPPTITTQPQSSSLASGESVTLTVVANGTPPLTYQWAKDGVDIPGATSDTYDTGPLTETAVYEVIIANAYGTVTSTPATVTVLPPIVYAPTWYCSLQSAATQVVDGQAAFFVRGRYHPAITLETQLLFEGRRFQVQSISDVDERHVDLVLMCVEVVARGRESVTH